MPQQANRTTDNNDNYINTTVIIYSQPVEQLHKLATAYVYKCWYLSFSILATCIAIHLRYIHIHTNFMLLKAQ